MSGQTRNAHDFNTRLGRAIAVQRARMGMSQKDLSKLLGVSFQQIQKYESGGNRFPVARLHELCKLWNIGIGTIIGETEQEYVHDKQMTMLIQNIYKLSRDNLKIITTLVDALAK